SPSGTSWHNIYLAGSLGGNWQYMWQGPPQGDYAGIDGAGNRGQTNRRLTECATLEMDRRFLDLPGPALQPEAVLESDGGLLLHPVIGFALPAPARSISWCGYETRA